MTTVTGGARCVIRCAGRRSRPGGSARRRSGPRAPGYRALVIADEQTAGAVRALIEETYAAMSTPGSDVAELFGAADIAIAGSGQGELWTGPEEAVGAAAVVSSWGLAWTAGDVTIWRRDHVAWAQILGSVRVIRDGVDEVVPYWTTGVFGLEDDRWRWLYWGGSEPQESPKV
jgi:hypothetical protein